MFSDSYIGKIAAFYVQRGAIAQGLPHGGAKKLVGVVIAIKPAPAAEPGNIPNCILTVRGRSGKTMDVYLIEQWATIHPSWEDALEELKRP